MNEQVQHQINTLKLRCFDLQESYAELQAHAKLLNDAIQQIVDLTGCARDQLTINDVIEAVRKLVSTEDDAE